MAFRDDNEALRARVRALEAENEELKRAREEPAVPDLVVDPPVADAIAPGGDLADMVRSHEAAEHAAKQAALAATTKKKARKAKRLATRPRRVRIGASDGRTVVHVAKKLLRDKLYEHLGWGFGFAFINPGVFIAAALAGAIHATWGALEPGTVVVLAVTSWAVLLTLSNVAWAWVFRRSYRIELTGEHFAVFAGASKDPKLLGRRSELMANLPDPDAAALHDVTLRDGRASVELEKLSPADLEALRAALGKPEREEADLSALLGS